MTKRFLRHVYQQAELSRNSAAVAACYFLELRDEEYMRRLGARVRRLDKLMTRVFARAYLEG